MLCWWNSHYTFNDAHIWILDATYITKQAIDVRYIHCTNVASWSLRPRSNYGNIWSRNSHCKAIILDSSYIPHPFAQKRNIYQMTFDPLFMAFLALLHQVQNLYRMNSHPSNISCSLSQDKKSNIIIFEAPYLIYFAHWVITENIIHWYYFCFCTGRLFLLMKQCWQILNPSLVTSPRGHVLIKVDWFWLQRAYLPAWWWSIHTW